MFIRHAVRSLANGLTKQRTISIPVRYTSSCSTSSYFMPPTAHDRCLHHMEGQKNNNNTTTTTKDNSRDDDIQTKLTTVLEQELKIHQAAVRRSAELDTYLKSNGYTVSTHDGQYRWTRIADEYHVTVTSVVGLPEKIQVKIQKPGKGSSSVPTFVMELTVALNIEHVSVTDAHHPHPLILMPAPHKSLAPYTTTAATTTTTKSTPAAATATSATTAPQYQGWMCDACGTASTSFSWHCQRGCEYDLCPSCLSSSPTVSCTPTISSCSVKNVAAHQSTDIQLDAFGDAVTKNFNVFLESLGIDQQFGRHVWLYSYTEKFAAAKQTAAASSKTSAQKLETLTALRNFFAQ